MNYQIPLAKGVVKQIRDAKISQKDISRVIAEYVAQQTRPVAQGGEIDLQPADNGKYRTQNQWIPFFNEKGVAMISAPDVYRAGQSGSDELVKSLRKDFDRDYIVTSTRIIYNPNSLDAKIVHNHGSTVVKPTESKVIVPVYQDWTKLSKVLGTEEGKAYLSALFGTKDNAENMAKTLSKLSGKSIDDNCVWTPTQDGRKDRPERAVGFDYGSGRFHVDGDGWVDDFDLGQSRGVSVKSAKPIAQKIAA